MSGRTFTYQGNFDDFVRYLLPDVEMSDRRKSVGIGDSMLREVEEFLNRFVVTAVNDAGDIIFDAAGSYTFQGDVIIGGELQSSNWVDDTVGWQLRSNGTFEFNSSGDVRGDLGVHGDMTMFTGGAMKTNASGLRAEISEATTSTSIVGGSADFAGVDLFTGDAGELEPGLLGVSNSAAGYSTVVLAGADLAGAAQRSYVYFSSTTAGNTETRLSDPSRTYLTAGSSSVDINQTGTEIRVADGDLDIVVKNLPSGSYQDEINFAEDLFKVTLSNAERMRLDTTGLGIGTNAPAVPLHVASSDPEMLRLQLNDTSVAGGYIGFHHNSGRIGYIGFPDNDDLHIKNEDSNGLIYFSTNNLTRMAIEAGGQVGIGTSTPSAQLHVNAGTVNNVATFESTDAGALISLVDPSTTGSSYVGLRADGDELSLRAGNSNRVRIQADGDVGIGTTSPSYKLDVEGDSHFNDRMIIRAAGSDILTLEDSGGTNEGGYINFANSAGTSLGYIGYGNNDDIHIKNDDSGGNIYVGVAARWALQINTSGHLLPYADNFHNLGQSGRAWNTFYLHQGNQFSSGGYWTLRSRDSDRQVMELVSSERFKRDIVDMPTEEAYQVLDARVIKYRGIDDEDDVPLEAGLSAESLHNAGYEYAVRYDEGHWGETPRSIYYEYLTVPLIKICQDQRDRIESLETRLAALEA